MSLRKGTRPPLRILIAERFPEARARLEKLIAETGDMEIAGTASNGDEAVKLVNEQRPGVVLLDIDLPGGALTTIKKIQQPSKAVQIIVLGYAGQPEDETRSKKAGATAFLEKPFPDETLLALIRSLQTFQIPHNLLRPRQQGSYADLKARISRHFDEMQVDKAMKRIVSDDFEKFLARDKIILSRLERTRLFKTIWKEILQKMLDEEA